MIKEIIFDCFGVITQDGWTKIIQQYAHNGNRSELVDLNKAVNSGVININEFYSRVSKILSVEEEVLIQILEKKCHPETGVFNLIRQLKSNYKIGLISNINAPLEEYLPDAPLSLFDEKTLSYKVQVAKPDIRIFNIHLNKTGTLSSEAVFIDDNEVNINASINAGLHGIWYRNLKQLKKDLQKLDVSWGG